MWWQKNQEDGTYILLKEKFPSIIFNAPLTEISYAKIGGLARYYLEVYTKEDLIRAIKIARKMLIPHLIVGSASNLLFLDEGFNGLVIKNKYTSKEAIIINKNEVVAPSGISLLVLIKELAQHGLGGIEFLAPIPGTLGGAMVNNAGANGKEMKDVLIGANILDFNGEVKFIEAKKLGLSYRISKLKGLAKKRNYLKYPVILEVKLRLQPRGKEEVDRLVQSLFLRRSKSQAKGLSLGCVFRNPKIDFDQDFPGEAINLGRVSVGYLLDSLNFKNKRRGKIKISPEHANIFINLGNGKAQDFCWLIADAKKSVKEKYNLDLKEEIEIVENKLING